VRPWWGWPEQRLELSGVGVLVDARRRHSCELRVDGDGCTVRRRLTGELSLTVGPSTLSVEGIEVDQQVNGGEDGH